MRKIAVIFMLISISLGVFAKDNSLICVKVIPLPENRLRMDFQFAQPITQLPASFVTQKPARIVLDFIHSNLNLPADQKTKKIEFGSLNAYNIVAVRDRVRAILDLDLTVSYSGSIAGNVYSLVLNGKNNDLFQRTPEISISNKPVRTKSEIQHIDFRGIDKQGGRLILDVSDAGIPIDVKQTGKETVVNFLNTRVPAKLRKRFDVSDFHSPAQVVTMRQEGKNVRMTVLSKGDYGHYVYQVNKQFMFDFFPLTVEEMQQAKLKKQVFSGKTISLNFQKIDIRAVLQLLAEFTGVNMVVSDKVQGDITLRLNEIPWDQALDIILTTQGLDKRKTGSVLLIDTRTSMDTMEEAQLKSQQTIQRLEPIRSDLLQINYAKAIDLAILIKDKQNSFLSVKDKDGKGNEGKISVDARTNTIWIQDTATKIEEVRDLIKQLDVPVKQVQIEARIVEVDKNFSEDIGIRWGVSKPTHLSGTLDGANAQQTPPGSTNPALIPIPQRLNLDLAATPALVSPASVGLALAKLGDGILLDLEISALESEGRAELISSPRLITTNQQAASIESGEEIPYQESTSSGATAVSFKKAVLSLRVTPQITPDGKILMDLKINQDTRNPLSPGPVPSILTKQIQTSVLVNNGQTIVLGGIYTQNKNKRLDRIPFFGELPGVGVLFRRNHIDLVNQELLIFITPKIITNALSITTIESQNQFVGYK